MMWVGEFDDYLQLMFINLQKLISTGELSLGIFHFTNYTSALLFFSSKMFGGVL